MANYDSLNMAELLEESERLGEATGGGGGGFGDNFVIMPEKAGYVIIRLLPPAPNMPFFCATRTHRINNKSLHCPKELTRAATGAKRWLDPDPKCPCVVCKYYNELWKASDSKAGKEAEELQNQARSIKPIERYYYNCWVRFQTNRKGEREENVGPKILSVGKTLHERIIRAIVGDDAVGEKPLGDVTHFTTGRDLKIIKKMSGTGPNAYPNYDDSKFQDSSPLGDPDMIEKCMAGRHDLKALRIVKPADEIKLELKRHLGLVKDDNTFDISEFQKQGPEPSLEDQIRQETHRAPARESVAAPAEAPKPMDAALAEEDFLAELKAL